MRAQDTSLLGPSQLVYLNKLHFITPIVKNKKR